MDGCRSESLPVPMRVTIVFIGVALSFLISGCAMLVREARLDDKTHRQYSALVQQQSATTKHPLIGIYSLEFEADQETLRPEDGRKPLFQGVKIAAVRNDSKIEFVSLSSLNVDSYDLIPNHDAFLQGITLWEVSVSHFAHTNTWKGMATGVWGAMHENNILIASGDLHTGSVIIEIVNEQWLRIATSGKSYFLKKDVNL